MPQPFFVQSPQASSESSGLTAAKVGTDYANDSTVIAAIEATETGNDFKVTMYACKFIVRLRVAQ